MMADHKSVTRMLKTARGQIDGILRMVEEDRYCVDISTQLMATQALLARINADVLKAHIEGCVARPSNRATRSSKPPSSPRSNASSTNSPSNWCNGDRYVCTTLVQMNLSPCSKSGIKAQHIE